MSIVKPVINRVSFYRQPITRYGLTTMYRRWRTAKRRLSDGIAAPFDEEQDQVDQQHVDDQ
jgi:hypothetical protein